jgi:AraC-like DNA-binding protein
MPLLASHDGAAIANCRDMRAVRLKSIKADVLEHLCDELTVTAVALRQGITPRYIQMLFEIDAATFSEYVLGQRLLRAYSMLSNPRFAGLNITAVALESGFGDLSYFNRTFRRRFGTTPSGLRKTVYQDERTSRPVSTVYPELPRACMTSPSKWNDRHMTCQTAARSRPCAGPFRDYADGSNKRRV